MQLLENSQEFFARPVTPVSLCPARSVSRLDFSVCCQARGRSWDRFCSEKEIFTLQKFSTKQVADRIGRVAAFCRACYEHDLPRHLIDILILQIASEKAIDGISRVMPAYV
jgi:hypothetical protein